MYSIISTLDLDADANVNNLRGGLIDKYEILGKTVILEPHLSWLGAGELNIARVGEILTSFTQSISPIHLTATGFGIFSGVAPVLYLPVIKTTGMVRIHNELWKLLDHELSDEIHYFRPDQWLPHISLFYFDEYSIGVLGDVFTELATNDFQLHFSIDHFKLAYFKDGAHGLQSEHFFAKIQA